MSNDGINESVQAELERFANGYWSKYLPVGVPIPGFFSVLPGGDLLPEWLVRKTVGIVPHYLLLFALEVEHRRNPIVTRDALKQAATIICAPDYDFREAQALSDAVKAALWIVQTDAVRAASDTAIPRNSGCWDEKPVRGNDIQKDAR